MNKQIIIIGGFHEIIELCENSNYEIIGIIDNNINGFYLSYPILGNDNDAKLLFNKYGTIPLAITPDSPCIREKLFCYYSQIGFTFETIISPRSRVSKSATIGVGTIIQDGVNVNAFTKIGNFVKLNTNCNVMHDCDIGDFVTIAPNAVVLGKISIGHNTYVGANSTILPEKKIEHNSIIGAGAVVTKNVEKNVTVTGNPAK